MWKQMETEDYILTDFRPIDLSGVSSTVAFRVVSSTSGLPDGRI